MDEAASFGERGRSMLGVETLRTGILRGVAGCYCETLPINVKQSDRMTCLYLRCNSLVAQGIGLEISYWNPYTAVPAASMCKLVQ